MPQCVDCDLFLYADDTCLFQHKVLEQIKEELTKNLSNWFEDKKLHIHFGEDKTKSILFSTKNRKRKIETLDIEYGNIKIKQYSKVTHLGCGLDESLLGEAMALKIINRLMAGLNFFRRKNRYLTLYLKQLLCNQASAYEKYRHATIACLVTKFKGYRCVKSHTSPTK